jgi:hypothetical protein
MAKKVNKKYQETESCLGHCDGCTGISKIQIGMWQGGQWQWYTGNVRMHNNPSIRSTDFPAHDRQQKGRKGKRDPLLQDHNIGRYLRDSQV